jgi:hypothetical protein
VRVSARSCGLLVKSEYTDPLSAGWQMRSDTSWSSDWGDPGILEDREELNRVSLCEGGLSRARARQNLSRFSVRLIVSSRQSYHEHFLLAGKNPTTSRSRQPILQRLAKRFDRCGLAEFADFLVPYDVLNSQMSAD